MNLYLAVVISLLVLSIQTGLRVVPKSWNDYQHVFLLEWLNTKAKTWIPRLFLVVLIPQIYFTLNPTKEETITVVTSWLFWISAALVLISVILAIKYILLLPTLTLVGFLSLNIYSGYSVAEGIKRERANARIHLMDAGGAEIMGVLILPVANGIVYIPSDLCEPPDDQMIHFISWEAIKLVEDIAERNCASSDDQVRPPKT